MTNSFVMVTLFTCLLAGVGITPVKSETISCNMERAYVHSNTQTPIFSAKTGIPSLYYRADMDVNTDGAARSYHPDYPRGTEFAYNNIVNAITKAWNRLGQHINCDGGDARNRKGECFDQFIKAFEGTRDNQYNPNRFPKIETKDIIPWEIDPALGWRAPCRIKEGPNKGFFVSQTSLWLKSGPACDQSTYVDSLTINAVVYPRDTKWSSQGIVTDKGDLVVTRNRSTGLIAFALHGDSGPQDKIGEGSIALTSALSGKRLPPDASYKEVKDLKVNDVDYIVFPTHDVEKFYRNKGGTTQARIDEYGKKVFEAWGGLTRLNACSKR